MTKIKIISLIINIVTITFLSSCSINISIENDRLDSSRINYDNTLTKCSDYKFCYNSRPSISSNKNVIIDYKDYIINYNIKTKYVD